MSVLSTSRTNYNSCRYYNNTHDSYSEKSLDFIDNEELNIVVRKKL